MQEGPFCLLVSLPLSLSLFFLSPLVLDLSRSIVWNQVQREKVKIKKKRSESPFFEAGEDDDAGKSIDTGQVWFRRGRVA